MTHAEKDLSQCGRLLRAQRRRRLRDWALAIVGLVIVIGVSIARHA